MKQNKTDIQYAFFDCFDTIIHRSCNPDKIILLWAKMIKLKFNIKFSEHDIFHLRKQIEKDLTTSSFIPNLQDILEQMYRCLSKYFDKELSMQEFVQESINCEITIEKKNQFVDEKMLCELKKFKVLGVKCALISDFYLGKDILKEFLDNLQLGSYFSEIFVSCDYNKTKFRGDLYETVIALLQVNPSMCKMYGDNYISDYKNAKKFGFITKWTSYKDDNIFYNRDETIKRLSENYKHRNISTPFIGLTYILYYFIDILYHKFETEKINNVFFLSREGQLIKQLFDKYCSYKKNTTIKTHYLLVSRMSTYIPSLRNLEDEDFHVLKRQYTDLSITNFLKNIGMEGYEISDNNKIIKNFFQSDQFYHLISDKQFKEEYEKTRINNKKIFKLYLKQNGISFEDGVVLVDIGWKGTIQDNIYNALDEHCSVQGYYLGLTGYGDSSFYNKKTGLLFEKSPVRTHDYKLWSDLEVFLFENLIQANHQQIVGYEQRDNCVVALYKNDFQNRKYEYMKNTYDVMLKEFSEIQRIFDNSSCNVNDVYVCFKNIAFDTLYNYDISKIHFKNCFLKINEEDSFGNYKKLILKNERAILGAIKRYGVSSKNVFDLVLRNNNVVVNILLLKLISHRKKRDL